MDLDSPTTAKAPSPSTPLEAINTEMQHYYCLWSVEQSYFLAVEMLNIGHVSQQQFVPVITTLDWCCWSGVVGVGSLFPGVQSSNHPELAGGLVRSLIFQAQHPTVFPTDKRAGRQDLREPRNELLDRSPHKLPRYFLGD